MKYYFPPMFDSDISIKRINYLRSLNANLDSIKEELTIRERHVLFRKIQDLKPGRRFLPGDPVILPNVNNPAKPIHCTFNKYLTLAGGDRKVELMVDGERKEAWVSFVIPDMTFWFRELQ